MANNNKTPTICITKLRANCFLNKSAGLRHGVFPHLIPSPSIAKSVAVANNRVTGRAPGGDESYPNTLQLGELWYFARLIECVKVDHE